jgi:hypothetical protein
MQDSHEDHPSTVKEELEDIKQGLKSGVAFAGGFAGDDERRAQEREEHDEGREARRADTLDDDETPASDEAEEDGLAPARRFSGRPGS